jgi:hypothetical protein
MIGEKTYTIKGYLWPKKNNKCLPLHILSSLRINEWSLFSETMHSYREIKHKIYTNLQKQNIFPNQEERLS